MEVYMNEDDKLLGQQEVWEYLGISKEGFRKLQKTDENFPKPVKVLSLKKWHRSEIAAYLEETRQEPKK
jgi:predicted DNA-binding transcriptional regulator AlpA